MKIRQAKKIFMQSVIWLFEHRGRLPSFERRNKAITRIERFVKRKPR